MTSDLSVSILVPATSANVGCAFDCAAIAVALYLRVTAASRASGFEVLYRGPGAQQIPSDETNLIARAMKHFAASRGVSLPGAHIEVDNEIPLGSGLGSSATAIIAGIALGAELCATSIDAAETLQLALELEGHPDNIAAAVYGGFVVAGVAENASATPAILAARTEISLALDFVAVVPEVPLPTEKARAVLPKQYSREDVVANLQRTALLTGGFFSGSGLSPELFLDRLHQPYRSPLVPGIAGCLAVRHAGLAGVFLSGAGSAVMAIARHDASAIGELLAAEFRKQGIAARSFILKADNRGAHVLGRNGIRKSAAK
jgi:homoserine kinase